MEYKVRSILSCLCPGRHPWFLLLIYQMYFRSPRIRLGLPADDFPKLLGTGITKSFIKYFPLIVDRFSSVLLRSRPRAVSHISKYLEWMQAQPRPFFFPQKHWIHKVSIKLFSDPSHPFPLRLTEERSASFVHLRCLGEIMERYGC